MARNAEVHGPWRIDGGHPDGPEHAGSVMSIDADGVVDPSAETVPAVARRAVCSCGWSGPLHDAPRAEGALIVRRYRKQSREELAPEWRTHVAEWVPAPLDSPTEGEDTNPGRPKREKRSQRSSVEQMEPTTPEPVGIKAPETPKPEPVDKTPAVQEPLTDLETAARRAHAAAHETRVAAEILTTAVRTARKNGASWATIGAATGMSRQAAHERWRSVA